MLARVLVVSLLAVIATPAAQAQEHKCPAAGTELVTVARKAAYGRQLTVRSARAAGASWAQIGAALGTTKQSAWEAHSRWIDQQASQRSAYGHQSMDSQQAAAARALAGNPDSEAPE